VLLAEDEMPNTAIAEQVGVSRPPVIGKREPLQARSRMHAAARPAGPNA
jgi:hypothetical protein